MILINIGDELLIGQVVNTNAAFIGQQMAAAGFPLTDILTIGDDGERIRSALQQALAKSDLVIMTGGLGPTRDDITKKVICEIFHRKLIIDEAVLQHVQELVSAYGTTVLTEANRQQAAVPAGSTVLFNAFGTAPGLWIEQEEKIVILLPGVPYEMESILKNEVLPRLQKFPRQQNVLYKVLLCTNISESGLSDLLCDYEAQLPDTLKLAYLPKPGVIRLRLTAQGDDPDALNQQLETAFTQLKKVAGDYAFSDEDIEIQEIIGGLLRRSGRQLATAESCTGGRIAHLITSVPGSSQYFQGSMVSYSNEVKRDLLNVREENLKRRGAVSEEVVSDMALNTMGLFNVDYAVATSGIAGPDGGTPEKPVGTVWIAVATPVRLVTKEFRFSSRAGRAQIVERAAQAALNMLRIEIEKDIR